jgi:hypothetical protein
VEASAAFDELEIFFRHLLIELLLCEILLVKSPQECLHLKVVRAPRIKPILTIFFCDPPHEFVLTLILAFEHLHRYELGITRLFVVDILMESLLDVHTHVLSDFSLCCITDLGTTGAAMIVYQMPSTLL